MLIQPTQKAVRLISGVIPYLNMKKFNKVEIIGTLKTGKHFLIHFLYYLLIPVFVYSLFIAISWLLNKNSFPIINTFLNGIGLSVLFFIALFIIPLKSYQYRFIPPASWEETIFHNYWIYLDIVYLTIIAFLLALFIKRIKLRYSWGIYLIILIASRILMHVALHIFGYNAYFDLP